MVLTESAPVKLGHKAPDFTLFDAISNKNISLQDIKSDIATVIMFICNHCPYVQHIQHELSRVAQEYQQKGIQFIAIQSNDADKYPEDAPENMKKVAKQIGYPFPYLYDETQAVAKAYDAACTPDIYVYDKNLACVYHGRFDDSSPGKPDVLVTGKDLRAALDNLIAGEPVNRDQKPSMGCSIKWKVD